MAERISHAPQEDRGLLEQGLRGGEGFNNFTKRVQFGLALGTAFFAPGLSAAFLAGGILDNEQQHYAESWADQMEEKRRAEVAAKYGPNKVVVKGKILDRHAAAFQQTEKSEGIAAKMRTIVNVKALEEKRKA